MLPCAARLRLPDLVSGTRHRPGTDHALAWDPRRLRQSAPLAAECAAVASGAVVARGLYRRAVLFALFVHLGMLEFTSSPLRCVSCDSLVASSIPTACGCGEPPLSHLIAH
jgi:hypothetical protein